jgi:hypothetical protein
VIAMTAGSHIATSSWRASCIPVSFPDIDCLRTALARTNEKPLCVKR